LFTLLTAGAAPPDAWSQLSFRYSMLPRSAEPTTRSRLLAAGDRETDAWSHLRNKADWEKYRDVRLAALKRSLGTFPEPPKDLKVKVRKTLEGDDYRIDCLTYESRPGLLVTANLYRPVKAKKEGMPGIAIIHSHHNPKTQGELQDMGVMWARAGCYVLVMDMLGHGERRQHPFATAKDYPKSFAVSRQDYHFRYNLAMQLQTMGDSLIGWMVWDVWRGIDLLLSRPGIDKEKIILMGSVAGGGDPCAVAAALDDRIKCAVPFNFGGPQPETRYPLPKDAEKSFLYTGSGSWESTRNLARSASDGFMPWVIVGGIAPRKVIYAHEFAWDGDRDPVWKRLQKIYGWYGQKDSLAEVHGSGSVRGKPPESTHCNNIGMVHRKGIHAALKRWFGIEAKEPGQWKRRDASELWCLDKGESPGKVTEVAGKLADERLATARKRWKKAPEGMAAEWRKLLGLEGGRALIFRAPQAEATPLSGVEALWLPASGSWLLRATGKRGLPVTVAIGQGGPRAFLRQRHGEIAALLKDEAVLLVDLGGAGDRMPGQDRGRGGAGLPSSRLMLGEVTLGEHVRAVQVALLELRKSGEIDEKRITLWGESFSAANEDGMHLRAPLEHAQPRLAEPMGAHVALLVALFDKDVSAVRARGGLVGYRSLLDSPFVHVPYDVIVPGALTAGDLVDVVAALAPRKVTLEEMVDGLNRRVPAKEAAKAYAIALGAYKEAKAEDKLVIK
jgi:dienelactone hydrolase